MKTILFMLTATLACAAPSQTAATPAERLAALGIELQAPPAAIANYVPAVRAGNLVYLAGQIAKGADGKFVAGKVGDTMTEADAAAAARQCGIQLLAALQAEIGDLAKVKRVVRVAGYVNATADFTRQSFVINGCSDLLVEVFGDVGRHARASIGVASLPAGAPVEVEMIVEVAD